MWHVYETGNNCVWGHRCEEYSTEEKLNEIFKSFNAFLLDNKYTMGVIKFNLLQVSATQ